MFSLAFLGEDCQARKNVSFWSEARNSIGSLLLQSCDFKVSGAAIESL